MSLIPRWTASDRSLITGYRETNTSSRRFANYVPRYVQSLPTPLHQSSPARRLDQ